MAKNPLLEIREHGQSVWQDYIRRKQTLSGELEKLIAEDGLRGQTSNPTYFEKAIAGSNDYDDALKALVQQGKDVDSIYEALAVEDIQAATDLFRPIYDSLQGADGFVSLEVSPELAHDTQATIEQARHLVAVSVGVSLQSGDVGVGGLLIRLQREQESDVDVDAFTDELLNGRYASGRAGHFDHHVGPIDGGE